MSRLLLLLSLTLASCDRAPSSPADLASTDLAPATCQSRLDCRLYSSYCPTTPCQCLAVGAHDVDPPCVSGHMTCIIDPCSGKSADCVSGVCVVTP